MGRRWCSAVLIAVLAAVLAPDASAMAATPAVVIDPGYGPPLTTIKVTGSGYCSDGCSDVVVKVGTLFVTNGIPVNSAGNFTVLVRIPGSARPGTTPVAASQTDSHSNPVTAQTDFNVTISQPAPTTYPAPTGNPPPHALPSSATTQAPTNRAASSTAPVTTASSSTSSLSPSAGSSTRSVDAKSGPSGISGIGITAVAAGAVLAVAVAIGIVRSRRRRHR